jgi:hypothetical protein
VSAAATNLRISRGSARKRLREVPVPRPDGPFQPLRAREIHGRGWCRRLQPEARGSRRRSRAVRAHHPCRERAGSGARGNRGSYRWRGGLSEGFLAPRGRFPPWLLHHPAVDIDLERRRQPLSVVARRRLPDRGSGQLPVQWLRARIRVPPAAGEARPSARPGRCGSRRLSPSQRAERRGDEPQHRPDGPSQAPGRLHVHHGESSPRLQKGRAAPAPSSWRARAITSSMSASHGWDSATSIQESAIPRPAGISAPDFSSPIRSGRVEFRADARVHFFSFDSLSPAFGGQETGGPVFIILLGADF